MVPYPSMFPVLFTFGKFAVSSFGVFLAVGFLFAVFLIWRLARAWDLDEERILDLTLLTFLGGLIGARLYFVLEHLQFFLESPSRIIIFTKFPGFSFWGAFLGGWLTLFFFTRRFKLDFWQLADIGTVGFLGGLIVSDLGCLLGSCNVGIASKLFFAVSMQGVLGKRLPSSGIEALLVMIVLLNIWAKATHFHLRGKIVSLSLFYIGIIKFLMEPLRENHSDGYFFSSILIILGLTIFYKITKRNPISDIKDFAKFLVSVFKSSETRKLMIQGFSKYWYNQRTSIVWKFRSLKKILKRFNVKFSYKNSRIN